MKKLILGLTIAAFASVATVQAGEDCAKACAKTTSTTSCDKATKVAKAAECSKATTACCSSKKTNLFTTKGATLLMAKR